MSIEPDTLINENTAIDTNKTEEKNYPLLDRDVSLLAFNHRVLSWAQMPNVPLMERLRYLCIVSSNLDEFFEVRAQPHVSAWRAGLSDEGLKRLLSSAHELVDKQYATYNELILPAMAVRGIKILSHIDRTDAQRKWVREYFLKEVKPLLVPVGLDPAHPFPQVANKSLNFIVKLKGADAFGRENGIAIVKVPRVLPRVVAMPEKISGGQKLFVMLSSVVRAHLADLFPGREVTEFSHFRVTRDSDLSVDEQEVKNLRTALQQGLHQRHYGKAMRIEVSSACSSELSDFLLTQFNLPQEALFKVKGPVNLVRLQQLISLAEEADTLFKPYKASYPKQIKKNESIFSRLKKEDVLIHLPFESFDGVIDFLDQAVHDPDVLAIKQTIYRTGNDSRMMDLLIKAQQRGKEVTVVVELKARFDEEANINWAERLEQAGAQVVYGVVGLKTHAKMLLITRREESGLTRYGHLSTGNYNPKTAALYTDLSYMTADEKLTSDMDQMFVHLASHSRLPRMQAMLFAPHTLHENLLGKIEQAQKTAQKGGKASIIAKMNSLTDEALIKALLKAGDAGVQINLIVRGACMLPAHLTKNIKVVSIIGRFLEHSRVFYFKQNEEDELWLSSADWMSRNMMRRVESAWPVRDEKLKQRVIEECLTGYLKDKRDAWNMGEQGQYQRIGNCKDQDNNFAIQDELMKKYAAIGA